MKRAFLGLCAFAFLAFVGVQASHHHDKPAPERSGLCAAGLGAVRHAPGTVRAPSPGSASFDVEEEASAAAPPPPAARAEARGPPSA